MSAVKNLRAMFENKGETSPPAATDDRGRSPGVGSTGTESPRPLSRIRTNFIAIEKDGRIGLQRDPSRDSSISVSTRKLSDDLEAPNLSTTSTSQDKANETKMDKDTIRRTSLKEQPIPESPRTDSVAQMPSLPSRTKPHTSKGKAVAPPANPDNMVDIEEPKTKMVPGGPTDKAAVTGNKSGLSNGGSGETSNSERDKGKGKAPAKETSKPSTAGKKPIPAAVTTTSKTTTTKSTKSPTVSKPMKSPATPKLASKTPERNAAHPEKTSTPRPTTMKTTTTSGPSSVKKPPPLHQPSPSSTGFIKPKVKSPTRPVKLPPGLTTHTAASATKSRQSLDRPHSRASVSTVGGTAGGKSLKRQSSTINRPRPSIGPPPKQPAKDHPPVTKREREVDEGFLARMMRPTAASSSKTAEKVPVPVAGTPPRKTAAAAVVAGGKKVAGGSKAEGKVAHRDDVRPFIAKSVPVQAASSSSTGHAEGSSAKEVAPVVERVATVEEAVEAAREIEGTVALPEEVEVVEEEEEHQEPEEEKPAEVEVPVPEASSKQDVTIGEMAPIVEQLESAEEVVEVAKGVEGEVGLPAEPEAAGPDQEEQDAPEEAPSEATLVNGTHDKTAAEGPVGEVEDKAAVAKPDEETAEETAAA